MQFEVLILRFFYYSPITETREVGNGSNKRNNTFFYFIALFRAVQDTCEPEEVWCARKVEEIVKDKHNKGIFGHEL